MRVILYLIGACLLTLNAGCSALSDPIKSLSSGYGIDPLSDAAADGHITAAQKLQSAVMKKPEDGDGMTEEAKKKAREDNSNRFLEKKCFDVPVITPADEPSCRQQRNAAVATLLIASDEMCQDHLKGIFGKDAVFNMTAGSVAIMASGLGTIVNGVAAKTALSGVSTLASGERALGNEVVYRNMIVPAITKKIREARTQKGAAMIPGNFAKGMDEYPMAMAFRDVVDYHGTCSFMYGLEKALDEGSQANLETKKAKLEQDKQNLELYIDNRRNKFQEGGRGTELAADAGSNGAKARVQAIEQQLLALENATAPLPSKVVLPADTVKVSSLTLDFTNQKLTDTVTYRNNGSQAVTVNAVTLSGTGFAIDDDTCNGKRIDPDKECKITVQFRCTELKCGREGLINIFDNTLASPRKIHLSGKLP